MTRIFNTDPLISIIQDSVKSVMRPQRSETPRLHDLCELWNCLSFMKLGRAAPDAHPPEKPGSPVLPPVLPFPVQFQRKPTNRLNLEYLYSIGEQVSTVKHFLTRGGREAGRGD